MLKFNEKTLSRIFGLTAALMLTLDIVGGVQRYSSIPFWDMWDGCIGFYMQVSDGNWSALWAQHNEHRIFLSRLLFWADLSWFQGAGWFLIGINYLLMGIVAYLFWLIWRKQSASRNTYLGFFLVAWLFSWIQHENLTWAFQSQFWLAQLLPLLAFYFLHLAFEQKERSIILFSIATLFGITSVVTMANGILVLPLMTVYALLLQMKWQRTIILAIFSIVMISIYFYNYHFPIQHGSLLKAILENPFGLINYILVYIGGPFYYFAGHGSFGRMIAEIAGVFLIVSSIIFAVRIIPHARQSSLSLALLIFILYVECTAVGTAGGRLIFGIEQATSSRYETPTLMVWAALLLLYIPFLNSRTERVQKWLWTPFIVVVLLMLPQQFEALSSKYKQKFEDNIGILSLELGIKDQIQVNGIYPSVDNLIETATRAKERHLSIFGASPFKDMHKLIGQTVNIPLTVPCQGSLDAVESIDGEPRYFRVSGWLYNPNMHSVPETAQLVDPQGVTQGIILAGQMRPDVANVINSSAKYSGFKGYILADMQGKSFEFVDPQSGCHMTAKIPELLAPTLSH